MVNKDNKKNFITMSQEINSQKSRDRKAAMEAK